MRNGDGGWRVAPSNGTSRISKKRFLSGFSEGEVFFWALKAERSLLSEKTVIIQIDDATGNRIFV